MIQAKWTIDDIFWDEDVENDKVILRCSSCNKEVDAPYDDEFQYCPHCGAKMSNYADSRARKILIDQQIKEYEERTKYKVN